MKHETVVQVRFCETDALGHVNNVSYFIYMETARVGFVKSLGLWDPTSRWSFVVVSTSCEFKAQAFFDDELKILTEVARIGNSSADLKHEIINNRTGQLIALGRDTIVHFDVHEQKSRPFTEEMREKLRRYMPEG